MRLSLIIHERRNRWARRIRPRLAACAVRLVESRSAADLVAAMGRSACPIVLLDLTDRPLPGLDALDRAARTSADPLILVLTGTDRPGYASLARELGATLVLPGSTPPPRVLDVLARWFRLARERSEAAGWAEDRRPEPEPWEAYLDPPLGTHSPAAAS